MKNGKHKYAFTGLSWTDTMIQDSYLELERIAHDDFSLDTYSNQIEIITSEQMLDAYSTSGMPIHYGHWSYGKSFITHQRNYASGGMGLAYEIVINSNPCISYLMEDNTALTQILVMAHACFGHNAFFKNNYLFKQWTDADAILDYLVFSKKYIQECEQSHGTETVEAFLDACHALRHYGVDKYKRPQKLNAIQEKERQDERIEYSRKHDTEFWQKMAPDEVGLQTHAGNELIVEPQENILYFLEKHTPNLPPWKRELIRIVRKMSQYFHPQMQTQVMNEGFACIIPDTLVDTASGLIRAGDIVEAEMRLSVFGGETTNKITQFYKPVIKKRIKITTSAGYEIHGGYNHKILIGDSWTELCNVTPGDELHIHAGCDDWPTNYYHKLCNNKGIATSKLLDKDMAYWLGLFIAGGKVEYRNNRTVTFFISEDTKLHAVFANLTKSLFGLECELIHFGNGQTTSIRIQSSSMNDMLRREFNILICDAEHNRNIPELILTSPKDVVVAFLKGHFDGNGVSFFEHQYSRLCSMSKKFLLIEQQLLLKMQIHSTVGLRGDGFFILEIDKKSMAKFNVDVGGDKKTSYEPIQHIKTTVERIDIDEGVVVDFGVEDTHRYRAGGFINHNCFTHYALIHKLYDKKLIDDGYMLEFYDMHTGVVAQRGFNEPGFGGINVYSLGFNIFQDIKRMCLTPTEEDKIWFPNIAGNPDWNSVIQFAMKNFKDESFILQYLSPKVIRDMHLFSVSDVESEEYLEVSGIHDKEGYRYIRNLLSKQYTMDRQKPDIQITNVDVWGDRTLTLEHTPYCNMPLHEKSTSRTLFHLQQIWGYDVVLTSKNELRGHITKFKSTQDNDSVDNINIGS